MSLMSALKQLQAIRLQIIIYLYSFRIYRQVRRLHEKWVDQKKSEAEHSYMELAKFPHLWPICRWYAFYTSTFYVYAFLKYIHPELIPDLVYHYFGVDRIMGLPVHCFLVGRFVAYPRLDRIIAILHGIANLSWRILLAYANRPYRLDVIEFLSQRDEHVRNYCDQRPSTPSSLGDRGSGLRPGTLRRLNGWRRKFHLFHPFMSFEAVKSCPAMKGGDKGRTIKLETIRPNRTPESKKFLEHRISRVALMLALFLGSLSLVSLALIAREITFDARHLTVYPNCDPELERLIYEQNGFVAKPIDEITSSTATRTHVILGICDFLESASIWFESGVGITVVYVLPYMLVLDLKLYMRLWHLKLLALLKEARHRSYIIGYASAHRRANQQHSQPSAYYFSYPNGTQVESVSQRSLMDHDYRSRTAPEFDESIEDLRQEVCDFFSQFDAYELVMSDIISATFVFWFLGIFGFGFTLVKFYAQGHDIIGIPLGPLVAIFLTSFSVPIAIFSICIFQLQSSCDRSYRTIHSLLVFIGPKEKEKCLKILEYFSEQKRHQFRFLMGHFYTPTTLVTIVSWTLSWLTLSLSLTKQI